MTRRIVRCVSVRGCTFHDWCLRHWSNDHWLLAPVSPEHSTEPSPVAVSSHHNTPGYSTTHPVLRPNIFISKHFRLSVLSGFPGATITQRSCRGLELDRGGAEHCSYSVLSEQAGLWSVRRGPGTSSDRRHGPQPGHSGVADSRSGKISHGRWRQCVV